MGTQSVLLIVAGYGSGTWQPAGKVFRCLACGLEMNADVNAAINIKKRGTKFTDRQPLRGRVFLFGK